MFSFPLANLATKLRKCIQYMFQMLRIIVHVSFLQAAERLLPLPSTQMPAKPRFCRGIDFAATKEHDRKDIYGSKMKVSRNFYIFLLQQKATDRMTKHHTLASNWLPSLRPSLLMVALAALFCSCSDSKHYVIGVSQCSIDNWRDKFNNELRTSAFLYDDVSLMFASSNDNDLQQIRQIDSLVNAGVDLLVVAPNQVNTIQPALERAKAKRIPIILFDRKTSADIHTAFIGADNKLVGYEMGEYVAHRLNGHGRVLEIQGLKGSSPAIKRHEGFVEALAKHPDIEIVAQAHAGWLQQPAKEITDSIIRSGQQFDCVFAQNDRMAMGARQAVESAGIGRHITYIGVDALPTRGGGLECVRDSLLDASYIYPTRGDLVMQLAVNILEGKPYNRDNALHGTLVTRDNAEALLLQNEELAKQQGQLYVLHDRINLYLSQYGHQRIYAVLLSIIVVLLIVAFAFTYHTIMTRRRMAENAVNAKINFFTNLSHEFRTPITLLADPVERLLADPDTPAHQVRLLRLMRRNIGVLLRLVNDILDFRKVQDGKMALHLQRFDMADATRGWAEVFQPLADKKQIRLTLDIPETLEVCSDVHKMERIVYNLLSNAMKYTPSGGSVGVTMREADDDSATIVVADTGVGIAHNEIGHVFERFYQVDNKKQQTNGTGIGLAIVKAFADLLGGSISIDSTEGKGTAFTLHLPRNSHAEAPQAASEALQASECANTQASEATTINSACQQATSPEAPEQRPLALVVDDNDDVRTYISSILAPLYDVKEATNGQEGLTAALQFVPDIIVCDIMMPVMTGLEMCQRVKAEKATSHIPVILLTARSLEEQRAEGYDCGADAYLTKPFNGQVLLARTKNLLEGRRKLKLLFNTDNTDATDKPVDTDSLFLAELREKVQQQLADSSLSVETLGADMRLSRVQLYRKVKALTGQSPVEIIRIARLRKAEQLIKRGDKTIAEISYEVGFSSPSYFTKCYKDFFGHTPGENKK